MSELERALLELGGRIEYPPTPDLAPRVRAGLAAALPPPRRVPRRTLAIALAILAVALGTALAVPPARTAILKFLHLKGVRIERVETLPDVRLGNELGLGKLVSLDEASRRVPYRILLPPLEDPDHPYPSKVFLSEPPEGPVGGQVGFAFVGPRGRRVVLTEFRGTALPYIGKFAGPGTETEQVTVAGQPGIWLAGASHAIVYRDARGEIREDTRRLAGNVLLWERGGLTLRLEGDVTKADALRIAAILR